MAMSSSPSTPLLGSSTPMGGKKPSGAPNGDSLGDKNVSHRIAYLWSASQVAFASNNSALANLYLNNLINYSESQGFAVGTDISLCIACNSLLIPGATAKVKLVPCESLSNSKHAEMIDYCDKSTTLANTFPKTRKKVKNALVYKCKRCLSVLVTEGTSPSGLPKRKTTSPGLSFKASATKSSEINTQYHGKTLTPKEHQSKPNQLSKTLSKEVAAKEERQRLLAAMLKSSTKQPPKKVDPFERAAGSPKKSASPAPAKTPKKSLFNFLNSL